MHDFLEHHPFTASHTKSGNVPKGIVNLLASLLSYDPSNRPSVHQLMTEDPWLNDPTLIMSIEEYQSIMHRQYLINHNIIPPDLESCKEEADFGDMLLEDSTVVPPTKEV